MKQRFQALAAASLAACWCLAAVPARGQTAGSVEIAGQVSVMRLSGIDATDAGLGGRVTWNIIEALALEAVAEFFPTGRQNVTRGGRKFHGLFGSKIGWRADRIGVFAKARAGFARVGEGRQAGICILIFPPPEGCYVAETRLLFDLGGVVEVYPTPRSQVRVDVGNLVTRHGQSSYRSAARGRFANDLHVAVGVGARF